MPQAFASPILTPERERERERNITCSSLYYHNFGISLGVFFFHS